MVLLGTPKLSSVFGPHGQDTNYSNIETFSIKLRDVFNLCKDCLSESMSSIPPSAFSAGRIRETQRDMKVSNVRKSGDQPKYFNTKYFMELTPLKYNSKLMNSIWGRYNRYSPHNVKKVTDVRAYSVDSQQYAAGSPVKSDAVLGLPSSKLDNMWAAMNVSQSH